MSEKIRPHINREKKSPQEIRAQINRINTRLGERTLALAKQAIDKPALGVVGRITQRGEDQDRVTSASVRITETPTYGDGMFLETQTTKAPTEKGVGRLPSVKNTAKLGDWRAATTTTTAMRSNGTRFEELVPSENHTGHKTTQWSHEPQLDNSSYEVVETKIAKTPNGLSGKGTSRRDSITAPHEVTMLDEEIVQNLAQTRQATVDAQRQLNGQ